MLIIDPWVMDLGVQNEQAALIAAFIGRAQFRTHRRLGHVMNLGGDAERKRIEEWARLGKMCHEPVFCLRCGAGAGLDAWVRNDVLEQEWDELPNVGTLNAVQHMAVAFRYPCEGTRVARVAGAMLKGWLDNKGVKP